MARYSPFAADSGQQQNAYGGTTQFAPVQFPDFNSDSFSASANDDSNQSQNSWAAPTFGTPLRPQNTTSITQPSATSQPPLGEDYGYGLSGLGNLGAMYGGVQSFADGGAVPDDDEDDGGALGSNAGVPDKTTAGVNQALQLVKQAMMYGRKKHGLPADGPEQQDATDGAIPDDESGEESYAGGGVVEDIEAGRGPADDEQYGRPQVVDDPDAVRPPIPGDNLDMSGYAGNESAGLNTGNNGDNSGASSVVGGGFAPSPQEGDNSAAAPVAEAGAIPEDTNGVGMGSNPQAIIGYLQGADAMPPEQAAEAKKSVAASDPATANVEAVQKVAETGGIPAAWALLQHDRQQYDASLSHGLAALTGIQGGKPAEINSAIASANRAYLYMPDGVGVHFSLGTSAIVAQVRPPGGTTKTYNLTPQQFAQVLDIKKTGQFDTVLDSGGIGGVLNKVAGNEDTRPPTPGETGISSPGYNKWLAANGPGPKNPNINKSMLPPNEDDSLTTRAGRVGVQGLGQQQKYIDTQQENEAERENKLGVATERGKLANERAKIMGGDRLQTQKLKNEGAMDVETSRAGGRQARTDAQLKIAAEKLLQLDRTEQGRNSRAALSASEKTLVGMAAAGQKLTPEQKRRADDLIMSKEQLGAPRAPQPNATRSNAPSAPAPQMSPQDQQALLWANANPNDPRAAKIKQLHGVQ